MNNEETCNRDEVLKKERVARVLEERRARRHSAFVVGEVDRFNDAILDAAESGSDEKLKGIVSGLVKQCAIKKCVCHSCKFRDVCSSMCVDGVTIGGHIDGSKRKVIKGYSDALDLVEFSEGQLDVMQSRYDGVVNGVLAVAKENLENAKRDLANSKRDLENAEKAYEAVCVEVGISVDGKGSGEVRHE